MPYQFNEPSKGTVYEYTPRLQVFEFEAGAATATKAVLFIGGLTDGLLTVPYLNGLSTQLPEGWSLYNIIFSSSYAGWATGSLDRDVAQIQKCVKFLRDKLGKDQVVLMGNSTGCQDSIHYALKAELKVAGIILHSPVSDRYAHELMLSAEEKEEQKGYMEEVREWRDKYGKDAVLPPKFAKAFFNTPISCYRWLSLFEAGGDDDYFSEDLSDDALKSTFGKLTTPTLVLYSERDEFVPPSVDKEAIIKRWGSFAPEGVYSKHSCIVPECSHQLYAPMSGDKAMPVLVGATKSFLQDL